MLRAGKREQAKEKAAAVSALALQLAQDKKFRKRLLSAIEHGSAAGRRTRRDLGSRSAFAKLATDRLLLKELENARRDLEHAYGRLEAKRRTHRLRNLFFLAALASLAGVPQVRARIRSVLGEASSTVQRIPGMPSDSPSRPHSLEDLTRDELYARAQEAGIPGRSEMSKEELVEALRASG